MLMFSVDNNVMSMLKIITGFGLIWIKLLRIDKRIHEIQ